MLTQTMKIWDEINQTVPKNMRLNSVHDKALYALLMGYASIDTIEPLAPLKLNPFIIKEALDVIRYKEEIDSIIFIYGSKKDAVLSFLKLKFLMHIKQVKTYPDYLEVKLKKLIDVEYHLKSLTELGGVIYHLGSYEMSAVYEMKYYKFATCSLLNVYFMLKELQQINIHEISLVALIESLSIKHQKDCLNNLQSKLIQTTLNELTYENEFFNENADVFNTFKKILENNPSRSVWNLGYKVARLIGV